MEGGTSVRFLPNWNARKKARAAAKQLGADPSPENYLALARQHVASRDLAEIQRVCSEGLELHPGHAELTRVNERAQAMQVEVRVQSLSEALALAPRPALWRELCEALLQSGKYQRAADAAQQWLGDGSIAEARYYLARSRAECFYESRSAIDGREAWNLIKQASAELVGDVRPLEVQYELARVCGAWAEARTAAAKLLEIKPGLQALEMKFRDASARSEGAMPIMRAFADVEQTGHFVDDTPEAACAQANVAVRPLLQALGGASTVRAAIFQRGGTALVQGLHGATADRTARSVREVVQASRGVARRMALGRPMEVSLEGSFGSLVLSPGALGAAGIWCEGRASSEHIGALHGISGAAGAASAGGTA
ncbi:MAG: tetratricopeptide (TPR) repeat protein [Planctomycetota bacterium]